MRNKRSKFLLGKFKKLKKEVWYETNQYLISLGRRKKKLQYSIAIPHSYLCLTTILHSRTNIVLVCIYYEQNYFSYYTNSYILIHVQHRRTELILGFSHQILHNKMFCLNCNEHLESLSSSGRTPLRPHIIFCISSLFSWHCPNSESAKIIRAEIISIYI